MLALHRHAGFALLHYSYQRLLQTCMSNVIGNYFRRIETKQLIEGLVVGTI